MPTAEPSRCMHTASTQHKDNGDDDDDEDKTIGDAIAKLHRDGDAVPDRESEERPM